MVIGMIKYDSDKPHLALVAVMFVTDKRILNFYSAFLKFMVDKLSALDFYQQTVSLIQYLAVKWNVEPNDAQRVGVFGIKKYDLFNYLTVGQNEDPKLNIYRIANAFFRHLYKCRYELVDAETGLRHEIHAVHNLVMIANILLTHFLDNLATE
jgi:hypothetical protein